MATIQAFDPDVRKVTPVTIPLHPEPPEKAAQVLSRAEMLVLDTAGWSGLGPAARRAATAFRDSLAALDACGRRRTHAARVLKATRHLTRYLARLGRTPLWGELELHYQDSRLLSVAVLGIAAAGVTSGNVRLNI